MFIPLTPVRFLYRAMDLFTNRVGIICGDKQFTYGQFGERACRLANALTKLGVKAGDRVAYLSFNTHQLMRPATSTRRRSARASASSIL